MSRARISRRDFLRTGAAALGAGAVGLLHPSTGAAATPDPRFGGFNVGLQGFSLRRFPVERAVPMIHELGLGWVEFSRQHLPLDAGEEQIARVRQMLRHDGIRMAAHGVNPFTADPETNRRVFEFARRVGVRNLTANPAPEALDGLERLVEEYGVRIAIHNHGPGALYSTIDDLERATRGRHPAIGVCVDTGHFIRSGVDPVEAIHALGERVFGVHLKDFAEPRKEAEGVVLGRGLLDVEGVFQALADIRFPADGSLALEYEESPEDPMAEIRECLAVAAAGASRVAARNGKHSRPGGR